MKILSCIPKKTSCRCLFARNALYIFLLLISCISSSQNTDSLWKICNNTALKADKRLRAIDDIVWATVTYNPDTAIIIARQELNLSRQLYNNKPNRWSAAAIKNMGVAYTYLGNHPKALENYIQALKIFEEIKDKKGIGACYTNIGAVYQLQNNLDKSLEYYLKDLKITRELKDTSGESECLSNIGLIYYDLKEDKKALDYSFKALKISEETGNKELSATCYGNIGNIYSAEKNETLALTYYFKDLAIRRETGNTQGRSICYLNIGSSNIVLEKFDIAVLYLDSCVKTSKEVMEINLERVAYQNLSIAYAHLKKFRPAYEYHVKFKALTDTIFNEENSHQLGDLKTHFEVEKKEAELKAKAEAEHEKLKAIANEEKKRQQVIIFSVASVLVLVILFSLFLFNRFRITRKQKAIIEIQKVRVDRAYESLHEKNKEVMDSINYASRIQRALLPSRNYIEKNLNRLIKKQSEK
jgi:tetratricopeptide (TPR) repeat protein